MNERLAAGPDRRGEVTPADAIEKSQSAPLHPPHDPDEREIDQILADSLPASDAPPWTLSVAEAGSPVPPRK